MLDSMNQEHDGILESAKFTRDLAETCPEPEPKLSPYKHPESSRLGPGNERLIARELALEGKKEGKRRERRLPWLAIPTFRGRRPI